MRSLLLALSSFFALALLLLLALASDGAPQLAVSVAPDRAQIDRGEDVGERRKDARRLGLFHAVQSAAAVAAGERAASSESSRNTNGGR